MSGLTETQQTVLGHDWARYAQGSGQSDACRAYSDADSAGQQRLITSPDWRDEAWREIGRCPPSELQNALSGRTDRFWDGAEGASLADAPIREVNLDA